MSDSVPTLKPLSITLRSKYLSVDLKRVRTDVENLTSKSANFFSKPLDNSYYQVVTNEGTHEETNLAPADALKAFDFIAGDAHSLGLHISVRQQTARLRLTMIAEEYVHLIVDFSRKLVKLTIAVRGLEKAVEIQNLLKAGFELVTVDLPRQHEYLEPYLHCLLSDHPSTERNVFLIMRFQDETPFRQIVEAVRSECAKKGLSVMRADDREYTDDLWDNVLTYVYGCDYAIAIFDQINYREFNPNVALEVGLLFAQCKRVLLLKDKSIPVMPADIVGKIYRPFDTYDPLQTITPQIKRWLDDYRIGSDAQT